MSAKLRILSAAAAVLFIASCIPSVTEPVKANYWNDGEMPPGNEAQEVARDRCIENCG